jgi:hypothetical protein
MKVQARQVANLVHRDIYNSIPLFLCPALLHPPISKPLPRTYIQNGRRTLSTSTRRRLDVVGTDAATPAQFPDTEARDAAIVPLPLSCPGCGAPTQTVLPNEAGYYTRTRKGLKKHLKPSRLEEEKVLETTLKKIGKRTAEKLGLEVMAGM